MTQKQKNFPKILFNFMNIHKKKILKRKINMTQKKEILLNFINIHKKKILKRKINDSKKGCESRSHIASSPISQSSFFE